MKLIENFCIANPLNAALLLSASTCLSSSLAVLTWRPKSFPWSVLRCPALHGLTQPSAAADTNRLQAVSVPMAPTACLASTSDQRFSNHMTDSKASWSAERCQLHPVSLPPSRLMRTGQSRPGLATQPHSLLKPSLPLHVTLPRLERHSRRFPGEEFARRGCEGGLHNIPTTGLVRTACSKILCSLLPSTLSPHQQHSPINPTSKAVVKTRSREVLCPA